jgi:hypothetical protein
MNQQTPGQRGQNDIKCLYNGVWWIGQGVVGIEDQEGYKSYAPPPDQYGNLILSQDEIYIHAVNCPSAEINELDIMVEKSDNNARIVPSDSTQELRGYNIYWASKQEESNGLYNFALRGASTLLMSAVLGVGHPVAGFMFDAALVVFETVNEFERQQWPVRDPQLKSANETDSLAYVNASAAYEVPYSWPVDIALNDVINWIFTDQRGQSHSVTVTAILKYYSYRYGEVRTIRTSVNLRVVPDVGNDIAHATQIAEGTYKRCLDVIDYTDIYGIYVGSDYYIYLAMQPPSDANFDLYLYGPGSNDASPPIAASTNTGNSLETISYLTSVSGTYYIRVNFTYWAGHYCQGIYSISITLDPEEGSGCPMLFAWNGQSFVLDNNLLPKSEIAGGSDVEDYYKLEQLLLPDRTGRLFSSHSLKISEYEHEHDYIDQAKLLAVDHDVNTRIALTPSGEILTYRNPLPPLACLDKFGQDRLGEINAMDGDIVNSTTFYQGYEGDWLVLNFGVVDSSNARLIVRDDMKCDLICIEVQVPDATNGWRTVEVLHPRDYWAMEAVDLGPYKPSGSSLIVRLLWTAPHRLDYIGLETSPQDSCTLRTAILASAVHSQEGNVLQRLMYNDDHYAELIPDQEIRLTFILENGRRGTATTFVFYTEGHYERL